jgi:predicted dehydrogenase
LTSGTFIERSAHVSERIRVGVIGVGQIGKGHVRRYSKIDAAEIVAIADVNGSEAKRVAEGAGVERVFTDFRELLKLDDIQAVDVCLHNNLHAPVAIAAMEAGKDVYCEKPLAGSLADARAMIDARERTGRRLQMQANTLFAKETKAAKRLIAEGVLGDPYYAKSSYYRRRGRPYVDGYGTSNFVQKKIAAGGALFDMGIYHIVQVLHLLGNPEVLTVSGATHQEIDMYEERRRDGNYDVEELGLGFVRLAGGISFFIEEAWAIHLGGTDGSKIVGSKGGLTLDPFTLHSTVGDMEADATFNLASADTRWRSCVEDYDGYDSSQEHWIATLQGRVEPVDSAALGLAMMRIAEGIYLSETQGREVTSEEVEAASVSTAIEV